MLQFNTGDICRYDFARQGADGSFVLDANVVRIVEMSEDGERCVLHTHGLGEFRRFVLFESAQEILTPVAPPAPVYRHAQGLVAFA